MLTYAMTPPDLAKDIIVAGADHRRVPIPTSTGGPDPAGLSFMDVRGPTVAQVTHLFVRFERQGSGIGGAVIDAEATRVRHLGAAEVVRVTAPFGSRARQD